MVILSQVRQQLIEAREELQRQCADLQAQLLAKSKQVEALNVLLADEVPTPLRTLFFVDEEEPAEDNLTNKAREILRAAGHMGLKPKDITRRLKQMDVEVKDTFASNFVWRMKNKTHEAIEHNGRYYWKGFDPKTQEAPEGAS